MPNSSQYTISPAHVQSVHHISCQCPVNTSSLLPMYSQCMISFANVQRALCLYSPCLIFTICVQSMSRQYLIFSTAHAESVSHVTSVPQLWCPCPTSIPSLQPIPIQYVPHLYCKCPICAPSLLPMFKVPLTTAHDHV